jgi:hypothetical protein
MNVKINRMKNRLLLLPVLGKYRKKGISILLLFWAFTFSCYGNDFNGGNGGLITSVPRELYGGCPVANFALTTQILNDGSLVGHIWQNPGKLGEWLQDKGSLQFQIVKNGRAVDLSSFRHKKIERYFPFVENDYADGSIMTSKLHAEVFSPLAFNDEHLSALPVLMFEFSFTGEKKKTESLELQITPSKLISDAVRNQTMALISNQGGKWENGKLIIPLTIVKNKSMKVKVLFASYDKDWITASQFVDIRGLCDYTLASWPLLKEYTSAFSDLLPRTGDHQLDEYLRWYMTAGISLTRCTKDNKVLTLGYRELNQRDSFWTTWIHAVFFKNMEWKMIEESYDHIHPSGKVPTCILPEIDRHDDLDINLYLILRTARYYALYHNRRQLQQIWSKMRRVMDWVISRDFDHTGLPQQVSFWADWKDTPFMQDRKYSAYACLMFLAAADQMSKMAKAVDDQDGIDVYRNVYQKGFEKINRNVEDGGLWNGKYYAQISKSGKPWDLLIQDQTIGILYDVIPHERAMKIIEELNLQNSSPYGIRNSYPFLKGVCDAPGAYHNGAVWPWLSFMDAWSRMRLGRTAEAIRLIKTVAGYDLVKSGDYVPNEYINSKNGNNCGYPIQGWNANLFGGLFFGYCHPQMAFKL